MSYIGVYYHVVEAAGDDSLALVPELFGCARSGRIGWDGVADGSVTHSPRR
jgi:hypothetical protein